MSERLFDVPAERVVSAVACTWCGAEVGASCREKDARRPLTSHAQRWRDYWNATHGRRDQVPVYPAPWTERGDR
jgi:hypothetical protein